jgi:hypothetical protein
MGTSWDFDYLPLSRPRSRSGLERDFVLATQRALTSEEIKSGLAAARIEGALDPRLERAPVFWYRLRVGDPQQADALSSSLRSAGLPVRYVSSASHEDLRLGPRLDFGAAPAIRSEDWTTRSRRCHDELQEPGRWFLDAYTGVEVDRAACGFGEGTRLAVIDDQARDIDALELDREIAVPDRSARGGSHAAFMIAWAVGSRGRPATGLPAFDGIAPDTSVRLYGIPTPDTALAWLPVALVRAVDDGADVVVCATYVEGLTSPMLDDALEFAVHLGRGGLGSAVVFPTSREFSSPPGLVRPSLTLGLHQPASDPRVLCVAPSGRDGGWFLWSDKSGRRNPFSNRGPAVRVAAPGDDMAHPFATDGRLAHAESSGASAIAAGVALLALGANPGLSVDELYGLLSRTARPCKLDSDGMEFANPSDLRPRVPDPDGHDAKCGYGRVSALRACASGCDPFGAALVEIGEDSAARSLLERIGKRDLAAAYSPELARWAARQYLVDDAFSHSVRVLVRHLRLVAGRSDRLEAQAGGAMLRACVLLLDRLIGRAPPALLASELVSIRDRLLAMAGNAAARDTFESALSARAAQLWGSRQSAMDHRSPLLTSAV